MASGGGGTSPLALNIYSINEEGVFMDIRASRCKYVCRDHPAFSTRSLRKALDHVLSHLEVEDIYAELDHKLTTEEVAVCDIRDVFLNYVIGMINGKWKPEPFKHTFNLFAPCTDKQVCSSGPSTIHCPNCPFKTHWFKNDTDGHRHLCGQGSASLQ